MMLSNLAHHKGIDKTCFVQLFKAIFGSNSDNDQRIEKEKIKMLNETFHCQPPIAKKYQQYAPKEASTTKNCLAEGVCMFQLSTRFCQAPFCWADNAPKSQCKRQCQNPVSVSFFAIVLWPHNPKLNFQSKKKIHYLERLCKKDVDTVAIKVIRMNDISMLKPFYEPSYDLNFRAVLLIRDPRSMFHSRKSIALNLEHKGQWVGWPLVYDVLFVWFD